MKRLFLIILVCSGLTACYKSCAVGDPFGLLSYCPKESYEALMHPKSYGQYWTKPTMTTESWRQDWVECGGRANGSYGSSLPQGTADVVVRADEKSKKIRLDSCMQSKGYQYNYTGLTLAK